MLLVETKSLEYNAYGLSVGNRQNTLLIRLWLFFFCQGLDLPSYITMQTLWKKRNVWCIYLILNIRKGRPQWRHATVVLHLLVRMTFHHYFGCAFLLILIIMCICFKIIVKSKYCYKWLNLWTCYNPWLHNRFAGKKNKWFGILYFTAYVDDLFEEAFYFRKQITTDVVPPPMSHMYRKPDEDRQALFGAFTTRFVNN